MANHAHLAAVWWSLVDGTVCKLVFKPKVDILNICHDCQFFSSVLDELHVSHHAYAAGIVLRVHYKSMKCDFLFSQGSIRTLFRRGGLFSYMSTEISSSLQQCKNYENRSRFPKVTLTNVLPPFFMVHSVYYQRVESLCYISALDNTGLTSTHVKQSDLKDTKFCEVT